MATKLVRYSIDGGKTGKTVNWRNNPLITAERIALGETLNNYHSGLECFDTQEAIKYIWSGTVWIPLNDTGTSAVYVTDEVPTGPINGSNSTFYSLNNFVPESVTVFSNGVKIFKNDDYNTSGNNQIILNFSPGVIESLHISYRKL